MAVSQVGPLGQTDEANTFEICGEIGGVLENRTWRPLFKSKMKFVIVHAAFDLDGGTDTVDFKVSTTGGDVTGCIHTGKSTASGVVEGSASGPNATVDVGEGVSVIIANNAGDAADLAFVITCKQLSDV